jgi:hypothetical protein
MQKHKLVLLEENENRKRIKKDMVNFIGDRWLNNELTILQDVQVAFQIAPYNLSEGSVRKYLDEIVDARKISTWKDGKNRYYGLPKIPVSIKFGLAMIFVTIISSIFLDRLLFVDMSPMLVVYLSILITVFTIFSYTLERKAYK